MHSPWQLQQSCLHSQVTCDNAAELVHHWGHPSMLGDAHTLCRHTAQINMAWTLKPVQEKRKSCFISVLVVLEAQGEAPSTNIKLNTQILPSETPGEAQDAIFAMDAECQIKLYYIPSSYFRLCTFMLLLWMRILAECRQWNLGVVKSSAESALTSVELGLCLQSPGTSLILHARITFQFYILELLESTFLAVKSQPLSSSLSLICSISYKDVGCLWWKFWIFFPITWSHTLKK